MKRMYFILVFILSTFTYLFSQDNSQGGALDSVLATATEAKDQLVTIYDLDVLSYYNLTDQYDSDLKKKVFKKTIEYSDKLSELKKLKDTMLITTYYAKSDNLFENSEYDIKKKGFSLSIGGNWGQGTFSARSPKSIGLELFSSIYLKTLPTRQKENSLLGKGVYDEYIFIPVSEENGLEIENNKNNVSVFFFFIPSGKETVSFKYFCLSYGWYDMKQTLLKSNKVRIIVANRSTSKIYFDNSY
jgi:hypothetical protein